MIEALGEIARRPWGIVLFFAAVGSQLVIYTVFVDSFAITVEHRRTILGLLAARGESPMGLVTPARVQMQGGATQAMLNVSSRSANAADARLPA